MVRKRMLSVAVVAALGFALGSLAWAGVAYAQGQQRLRGPERFLKTATVVLDLSDAQVTQIRSIFENNLAPARPLIQQAQQARTALRDAIESGKTDTATLKPLADQIGSTAGQLALLRAQAAGQVYNILTPQQREKAKELRGLFLGPLQQNWAR